MPFAGFMCLVATFSSSVFSAAIPATSELWHVSTEVMTLGVSLNVLGYTVGPIFWVSTSATLPTSFYNSELANIRQGPLSEVYGRKMPLFTGYFIFAIFQIPVAVAQNVETVMICRFLGGCAACAPLVIISGYVAMEYP
jgi:MFS transporter, DHA1 family, multidrug resistance protein